MSDISGRKWLSPLPGELLKKGVSALQVLALVFSLVPVRSFAVTDQTTNALSIDGNALAPEQLGCDETCAMVRKKLDAVLDGDDEWTAEKHDKLCGDYCHPTSAMYGAASYCSDAPTETTGAPCNLPTKLYELAGNNCQKANDIVLGCKYKNTQLAKQCTALESAKSIEWYQYVLAGLDGVAAILCTTACAMGGDATGVAKACSAMACVAGVGELAASIFTTNWSEGSDAEKARGAIGVIGSAAGIALPMLMGGPKCGFGYRDLKRMGLPDDPLVAIVLLLGPQFKISIAAQLGLISEAGAQGLGGATSRFGLTTDRLTLEPQYGAGVGAPAPEGVAPPQVDVPEVPAGDPPAATTTATDTAAPPTDAEPTQRSESENNGRAASCMTAISMGILTGARIWAMVETAETRKQACEEVKSLYSQALVSTGTGTPDMNATNTTAYNGTVGTGGTGGTSAAATSTTSSGSSTGTSSASDIIGSQQFEGATDGGALKLTGMDKVAAPLVDRADAKALMDAARSGGAGQALASLGGQLGIMPDQLPALAALADFGQKNGSQFKSVIGAGEYAGGGGGRGRSGGAGGAGGANGMQDMMSAMLGGKGKEGAKGAAGMSFGDAARAPAGNMDIWHTGSTLSIFDIVTSRVRAVEPRLR
jgi:hypothetical protein